MRAALADAGINAGSVIGLAADTTNCSVVMLDEQGLALRPALIWMDVRSARQSERIAATGSPELVVNNNGRGPVSAEWMLPKCLWLKENEPARYAAAHSICEYQDFLNLRLTGRLCASINNTRIRWHFSEDGPPSDLLAALNARELLEKWPGDVLSLGQRVGVLTTGAAAHLGLAPGTPVYQGGADAQIGVIGLGVTAPGDMALITGSSHLLLGLSANAIHGDGFWGTYASALLPGLHVVEGGLTSTGSVISWFQRQFCGDTGLAALDAEAALVAPGSEGVVALDHFQGNRTPHTDPHSRGALVGLSLSHTRAHVYRALMESIAMGTRLILDSLADGGYDIGDLVLCGGASQSPLWLQIHADVMGRPLHLPRVSDAPTLGCAILAAAGAGEYDSIEQAATAMVHRQSVIEPDPQTHTAYAAPYARYQALYRAQRQVLGTQA